MSGTAQPMPFSMPMFRNFIPERIRPWIYVFIAVTFQFSGGLYLGTLNQMMGETTLMREDLLMCLYNPQIQISAESETKRSIFREKDKTKRSKKESAQHSKSRNKSFVMTSVSAL